MTKARRVALGILITCVAAMGLWWAVDRWNTSDQPTATVRFRPANEIIVEITGESHRVALRDRSGTLLCEAPVVGRTQLTLYYPWQAGDRYDLVLDGRWVTEVVAPEFDSRIALRLHLPLGQRVEELLLPDVDQGTRRREISIPVIAGETINWLLELEKLRGDLPEVVKVRFSAEFVLAEGTANSAGLPRADRSGEFAPSQSLPGVQAWWGMEGGMEQGDSGPREQEASSGISAAAETPAHPEDPMSREHDTGASTAPAAGSFDPDEVGRETEVTLEFEFDKRIWTGQVGIPYPVPNKPAWVHLEGTDWRAELTIRFIARQISGDDLSLVGWYLPTNSRGEAELERAGDSLALPDPLWIRVATWLGIPVVIPDFYKPFTWQTLRLQNRSAEPLGLLLESRVIHQESGQDVEYFASPELQSTGGTGKIVAYGVVEPGGTENFVLPVYVRPGTPDGTYTRWITVRALGSDHVLMELEAPLGVMRSRAVYSWWMVLTTGLSIIWLFGTAIFYRRMVQGLGVQRLVMLSLVGSLQFALQFAGQIVLTVLYAVLGPFNCLVGGLLTEVSTYLIVGAILFLVPRVGAMTLVGLVSYIMGMVLFGSFGILELVFVSSSIAFRELALLIFGVTSFGARERKNTPCLPAMAVALGIADAATTFTSLVLQAVFYRLFFATWYVFLQVFVTGFLYTAIGVLLSRRLGMSLRRVQP